jgi:ornithine lipid ester-linked acyl 2-hydroxylase
MFTDTSALPFVKYLEEHYATILEECQQIPVTDYSLWPQVGSFEGQWLVFPLFSTSAYWTVSGPIENNRPKCPKTCRILERIDGLILAGFSRLEPGTYIYPHRDGQDQPALRSHLGLMVHDGAKIRAGEQLRTWQPGKILAFDGIEEHEAINQGPTQRTVLIADAERERIALPLLPARSGR